MMKYFFNTALIFLILFCNCKAIFAGDVNYNTYWLQYSRPINKDFSYGLGLGFSTGIKFKGRFYPEFGFSFIAYDRCYPEDVHKQGAIILTNPGIRLYLFRWKNYETYLHTIIFGFNNILQLSTKNSGFDWDLGGRHLYIGIGNDFLISKTWLWGLEIGYLRIMRSRNPLDIKPGDTFTVQLNFINRFRKVAVDKEEIF